MAIAPDINDIILRTEILPGDLSYIAYMHAQLYANEYGYGLNFEGYVLGGLQEFASQYNPATDRVWICEHEHKIIGSLIGLHRENRVQLRYLLFQPEYRGLGLGKKLMDKFIAYMNQVGYNKAYLWTTNEQQVALSLYTRYGFKLTAEKKSDAFDKSLIELRYDLEL